MTRSFFQVKLCLDYGVNPNAPAGNGVFPLYLTAAKSEMSTALETLLQHGAKIDLKTIIGRTALHSACENFQVPNISLLLSFGADVLVEDQDGNTPFALIRYKNVNPCSRLMLKQLALIKACQPSLELKDERMIKEYPKMWDYYEKCMDNIYKMTFTRFTTTCTFFELVAGSSWQIAMLMLDPEFEINFRNYDVTEFSMYAEDILRAFEQAVYCHHFMLEQEDTLNEAVIDEALYKM